MEWWKKYRPTKLADLIGQDVAVKSLTRMIKQSKVPHAIMLAGPSGTGKTTIARILMHELGCQPTTDFEEINAAKSRGIDTIRRIDDTLRLAAMGGKARMWLIDEAHRLTGDSQEAMLKILEDMPRHAYFVLATTEPESLVKTVRNRCTTITVKALTDKHVETLLAKVLKAEGQKASADVIEQIVSVSEGSARKALVLLEQALALDDEDERLAVIGKGSSTHQTYEICRALLGKPQWSQITKMLKAVQAEEEPETTRRKILGYMNTVLLGGRNAERAAHVITCLRDNVYDSGRAGLTLAVYEACVR